MPATYRDSKRAPPRPSSRKRGESGEPRGLHRAVVLIASGITAGGVLLLLIVALNLSPRDVALYVQYHAVTSAIMLSACLLACIAPARRALAINPSDALKEA